MSNLSFKLLIVYQKINSKLKTLKLFIDEKNKKQKQKTILKTAFVKL